MSITHSKVSDKSDDADTTLIRPSDWNAAHTGEIPGADVPATHAGSAHHTVESGQSATHTHAGHDTAHAHSATTGQTATDHHSNANDHAQSHAHSAAGDGSTLTPAVLNVPTAAAPTPTVEGQAYWDSDDDKLVVGDGTGQKIIVPTASVSGDATMSTTGAVTVASTHAGTAHHAAYAHPNHSGDVTSVADGAQTIADAAVTLAKMANLEQDKFIGRTTASTGVPETATITAAARTVLDDVTVAAMVDTLGGAAATGTGGLARASSPTFVTPALGTPASGVLTNVTGLPTAGLVDDAVTLAKMAAGTDGNLITYDANGDPAAVATGSAGQVLTSNGAGAAPTFQAAAGGGAVTREGGNTTEATTSSVTAVDLLAAASLTIASGEVALAVVAWRRTAGVATLVQTGFKVNATQASNTINTGHTDAAAQEGLFRFLFIAGGIANYVRAALGHVSLDYNNSVAPRTFVNPMPTATVTDLVYTAAAANASNLIGMDEMQVYSYAAS